MNPTSSQRPPSPAGLAAIGALATAVTAEWLRFQFGTGAMVPALVVLGGITLRATVRAYAARRRWRLAQERWAALPPAPVASQTATEPPPDRPAQPQRAPALTGRIDQRDAEGSMPRDAAPAAPQPASDRSEREAASLPAGAVPRRRTP